jgi:NTP pyrophosphatase (non-canonical NTP hydrolase)
MKNYIELAVRTEGDIFNIQEGDARLLHAGIGLATESGEFLDALKKHLFYGGDLDKVNLKEELGDLLWYIALACDELGTDFSTLKATNIKKLQARYSDKFSYDSASFRDLEAERKILEDEG